MAMKKGFLFSVFVIMALSLVVISTKTRIEFKESDRADIFNSRVERTNLFLTDMEDDIERSLYVSVYRGLLGAYQYVDEEDFLGPTYEDARRQIAEVILNGTITRGGTTLTMSNASGSTFNVWMNSMQELSHHYNINVTYSDINLIIREIDHWNILFRISMNVTVIDFIEEVGWNFSIGEETIVDLRVASLPDPFYAGKSRENGPPGQERLTNVVRKTPYSRWWKNVSGTIYAENLTNHTRFQYYLESVEAPSYFMRFLGVTDCSSGSAWEHNCSNFGIESFVNVIDDRSPPIWVWAVGNSPTCAVDHLFFSDGCVMLNAHVFWNMTDDFALDDAHVTSYNLSHLTCDLGADDPGCTGPP